MPQIVTCPDCGRKLKVPDDLLGKKVKCPGCGQKFVGEVEDGGRRGAASRAPAWRPRPDDGPRSRRRVAEEEDEDRPKSRRRDDEEEDDDDYPVKTARDRTAAADQRRRSSPAGSASASASIWSSSACGSSWPTVVIGRARLPDPRPVHRGFHRFDGRRRAYPAGRSRSSKPSQMAGQAAGTMTAALVGGCLLYGLMALLGLAYVATTTTGMGFCMGIAPTRKAAGLKGLAIAAFSCAVAYLVIPAVHHRRRGALVLGAAAVASSSPAMASGVSYCWRSAFASCSSFGAWPSS